MGLTNDFTCGFSVQFCIEKIEYLYIDQFQERPDIWPPEPSLLTTLQVASILVAMAPNSGAGDLIWKKSS